MRQVEFIDRQSGQKITESVPAGGMMRFLYSQNALGRFLLWAIIKRRVLSVVVGWYMLSSWSKRSVKKFVENHHIDLSEFVVPQNGFKHFNQFFYRKIAPDKRPIGEGVVSPADGKIVVFPTIDVTKLFYIKGEKFNLKTFLKDDLLAAKYSDGAMAVIRLAPTDYHRFHFPLEGYVGENKIIDGDYYSVSPIALKQNMRIFCQNKRHYVTVDSDQVDQYVMSEVGATLTGSIVQSHWPNITIEKGGEKGFFAFGGSTVILLFQKDKIKFNADLREHSSNGFETSIKMGETIAELLN
ncbi:MAG: archaetidylserine decarboxylase [Putridiphycobacter sp.]|nr:archaetidylserine decarboxylase [Putridiphycobacter sp.]